MTEPNIYKPASKCDSIRANKPTSTGIELVSVENTQRSLCIE